MKTTFEKLGGTYHQEGDFLLPNVEVPESPQIGPWGQRRLQYLCANQKVIYTTMLIDGTLKDHLEEVDKAAEAMFDQLTVQMKAREGVTEELKANNQSEWLQRMNSIRNRVEEIIHKELIFV